MRKTLWLFGSFALVACTAASEPSAPTPDEITVTSAGAGFVAIARDGRAVEASLRAQDGRATIVTRDKRTVNVALPDATPASVKETLRAYIPQSSGIHTKDDYDDWCNDNYDCMTNPRPSAEAWAEWSEEQDGYHWSDADIDYLAGGIQQNCMNFFIVSKCSL